MIQGSKTELDNFYKTFSIKQTDNREKLDVIFFCWKIVQFEQERRLKRRNTLGGLEISIRRK